ncbi:MAG: hypothetical protein LBD65_04725, partial [Spirochaetaceae bacterium]|nr:hypothetical protein [Spirochaetaceae bacterium]
MKEAALFARTVPEDPRYYEEWINGLSQEIEGGKAMILRLGEDFNFFPAAADPAAEILWNEHKDGEEFQRGLESVYYLLPYEISGPVRVSGSPQAMLVYLLPVPDESGFDISGAVLVAVPEGSAAQFEGLLRNLAIIAWIIFAVLLSV